ncbi:type II toxin-antitoxin system Phd/YefM family antitoxin [Pseudoduganella umbonata]|uniref:Type II toxin-antitoxin system Phd/YefM family antitoxin n=1 Tax=Pseudoduganella umbonata TaxID=864828 RepID=A0A4P8HSS5_9BURK|nr:type II toxin-antitoxin system Phd/YefM family antitoxin [Pseudoduganella umbonata]MBB3222057.1 hypothetical protein [Pseudoduganella umbonata]QCP12296.1 type II toxin-antitoxin system Phd/YefM family antitoxin [Pseudoduganella umbonata]
MQAANNESVIIKDQGRPTHVLMTFDTYQRLAQRPRNIADALAIPSIVDIGFDPPRVAIRARDVEL